MMSQVLPLKPIGDSVQDIKNWTPSTNGADDEFNYIDISSVDRETKRITSPTRVTCKNAPSRARQLVRASDVLVSTVRPNLNGVALVPPTLDGSTASTGYCVLRANPDELDSRYLFYWVQTPGFIRDMVRKARGASYPAVSDRIVKESLIPLPPLPEQKRIADILGKADAIRCRRREGTRISRELFVATLESELDNLPIAETNEAALEDACAKITDGTHLTPKFREKGVPFIFVRNIVDEKICFDTDKFIDDSTYRELTKRTPIELGDVLYTTVGVTYGQAALVDTKRQFAFQRHIAHLKPDFDRLRPEFLAAVMNLPRTKRQADRWARGAAQPTLNLKELRKMTIPLPSLQIQDRIVTLTRQCDRISRSQTAMKSDVDDLFNSLVQRAFKGEL